MFGSGIVLVVLFCKITSWYGNCFVSLSKREWNCAVKQFWHWFLVCLVFLDDISPIHFDFVFCIGMTAVQSSLIWFWYFSWLTILNMAWSIYLCLFPDETETMWASSFNLNFGLVYLILFLDEHSQIHLQLIFHFVANINSAC